jgi:hypothetical protein
MTQHCQGGKKPVPTDTARYNRIKQQVKQKVKRWPSAYASAQLVSSYKRSGGRYSCRFGDLNRWFGERWTDVCTGKPCGRKPGEQRKYPYCRPTRRINSSTPRTRQELTPEQIKRRCAKKHLLKTKTLTKKTQFGQKRKINLKQLKRDLFLICVKKTPNSGFGGKANNNRTSTGIPNTYYQGKDVHIYYIDTSDDFTKDPVTGNPFKLHFTYGGAYKYTGQPNYRRGPHITYEPSGSSRKIHWSPANADPDFSNLPLATQNLIKKHYFRIFDNAGENMDIPRYSTPYKVSKRHFDENSGPYLSGNHVPSVTKKGVRPPLSPYGPVRKKIEFTSPEKRPPLPR